MAKAAKEVELSQQQVDAIQAWQNTKAQLDALKASELSQRLDLVATLPFNSEKEEGGQTVKLGGGWRFALDKPVEHKMETKNNDAVVAALTTLHAHNPLAMIDLMRWEPVMSQGAYKKLTDAEKLILAPVVTSKPGTPALELKPPAVKKD